MKVTQSHAIADEMAKLSMFAAQGNVKEMVCWILKNKYISLYNAI